MKAFYSIAASLILLAALVGCATTIKGQFQRPAQLNLKGAHSVSVLPFSTEYDLDFFDFDRRRYAEEIATYLTNTLQRDLLNTRSFAVIDPGRVQQALRRQVAPPCDIYITGSIHAFWEKLHRETTENKDASEKTEQFHRSLRFTVYYEIIHSTTGEILYSFYDTYNDKSLSYSDPRLLPTPLAMAEDSLNTYSFQLVRKMTPYVETRSITLLEDKEKRPLMEEADRLARLGQLQLAQEAFMEIYRQTSLFEAGYNAARLMEAQGQLTEAERLMSQVQLQSNDTRATRALKDIRQELHYAAAMAQQEEQRQSNQRASQYDK